MTEAASRLNHGRSAPMTTDTSVFSRSARNRLRLLASVSLGLILGWLLWSTSGPATSPPYSTLGVGLYVGGASIAGTLSTFPSPRRPWLGPVAVWLGQAAYIGLVYIAALPPDPMIFAPYMLVLFFGAVPPMIGAVPVLLLGRRSRGHRRPR